MIQRADSVTWNPHKLMGCLLQSSAFLVKEKVLDTRIIKRVICLYNTLILYQGILLSCNEMNATYLFQQDKHYDVCYDTGDKTIQCGRHVDVFKLWLMWRAKVAKRFKYIFSIFGFYNYIFSYRAMMDLKDK